MPAFHLVCRVEDVPEGTARAFFIGNARVGIFNIGGRFYAIDDACPHAGASLAQGEVERDVVRCRIHHWRFCVRDGTYLDADIPRFNVPHYRVRVAGNDVEVAL